MAFQYSAQTVTKSNGSIVDKFVREKTENENARKNINK